MRDLSLNTTNLFLSKYHNIQHFLGLLIRIET
jgi:hypothetical protein